MQTAEKYAYEFLKAYHSDDQGLVEGWRIARDRRWCGTVDFFQRVLDDAHWDAALAWNEAHRNTRDCTGR